MYRVKVENRMRPGSLQNESSFKKAMFPMEFKLQCNQKIFSNVLRRERRINLIHILNI